MPERLTYPGTREMVNWFWNDLEPGRGSLSVTPSNIVETKENFRIEMAVPGYSRSEIKITLDGQVLTISGDKEADASNEEETYLRREFARKSFSRSFRLSTLVDSANIVAKQENGILLVTIPKTEAAIPKPAKEIEIN
jgi:HSP20 family protein